MNNKSNIELEDVNLEDVKEQTLLGVGCTYLKENEANYGSNCNCGGSCSHCGSCCGGPGSS
ncbi:MAG: hypothetical protein PHD13_05605 [Methanocellales archaeon]|nr:hypothetical protein [Methanocellales archaeon]MDD3291968.1 hypothetical protein [Methanocellales archaeon]MDD5235630.1 hypothetical protein [Methanocellales archaeon]MDD5485477.1 hypothetical protein [Methanocellales archaeon]